jgi:hypothetical protein
MKPTLSTALGVALALSASAAVAVSGDTWSGTNRYRESAPIEVTTLRPGEQVIVYAENSVSTPVIVDRSYSYDPRYVYYYEPREVYVQRAERDWVKDLNPQTGQRVGDGLFNRRGPNDFGQ